VGVPLNDELCTYLVSIHVKSNNSQKDLVKYFQKYDSQEETIRRLSLLAHNEKVGKILKVTDSPKVQEVTVGFEDGKLVLKPLDKNNN
jgi:hypothetical protein